MHKNTFTFVIILAIVAALVVGVNFGKQIGNNKPSQEPTQANWAAQITPSPEVTPAPVSYISTDCGVTLTHPAALKEITTPETPGMILVEKSEAGQTVILTCQKDIPRSPLPADKIETIKIGSVSAKLYHDTSPKDGTPIDILIFKHPKKPIDVYLAGYGVAFASILRSITITP